MNKSIIKYTPGTNFGKIVSSSQKFGQRAALHQNLDTSQFNAAVSTVIFHNQILWL